MASELHPVLRSLLRQAPSGSLLDDLVRSYRPEPGAVTGVLGGAVTAELLGGRGLWGWRLIASTTDDAGLVRSCLEHTSTSVAAALAHNRHLDDRQVEALFARAVRDGSADLLLAVVAYRNDLHRWCDDSFFEPLTRRGSLERTIAALTTNVLAMSPVQFAGLRRLAAGSTHLAPLLAATCTSVLVEVQAGRGIDVGVLAQVHTAPRSSYGVSAIGRMRPTRGLVRQIEAAEMSTWATLWPLLEHEPPTPSSRTAHSVGHACYENSMQRIADVLGLDLAVTDGWSSWVTPLEVFAALDVDEQVALLIRRSEIADEVLHHLPDLRVALAGQFADQLPARVLDTLARYGDALRVFRDVLVERRVAPAANLAGIAEVAYHVGLPTSKVLHRFLEFFLSLDSTQVTGRALLDLVPTDALDGVVDRFAYPTARAAARRHIAEQLAVDPFASGPTLDAVGDVRGAVCDFARWGVPAVDWFAARLLECDLDLAAVRQVEALLPTWRLTPNQLVRTIRSL